MTIYLKAYAICLLVNKIHGLNSYRSSVNANGRPILRTGIEEAKPPFQAEPVPEDKPSWLVELRARIESLVSRHGYEAAKSHIKKAVEDTERKESVLLDVKVERDGKSAITYEYKRKVPLRSVSEDYITKPPGDSDLDPTNEEWVENVEKLVVAVLGSYSQDQIEPQLKPAINAIEKEKNIIISDIDGKIDVEIKQVQPKSKRLASKPRKVRDEPQILRDVTIMSE